MSLIRRTMAIASLVVVIATGQSLQDCLRDIHESDAKKRLTAVGLLGTFPQDDTVVAALIGALKDQTEAIRITAARVLAQNRTNAAQVVPVLEQMLYDPSSLIREGMAEALGKFGAEAAHAIPALEKLLSDPEILVRLYAIRSLGALAGTDKHAQGMIVQQLQDSHADIRRSALIALSGFGEASNNYLPQLLAAIKDPTDIVRNDSSIRDAIREISIKQAHAAVPLLIAVLNDPAISFEGRAVAVQTLGEIGPPAQGASADLQKACSDCPNWFGKVVEDALVKISPEIDASSPEGLAKAIAMLSRENAMSQQHARNALNKAGVIAVPPLLELLRKPQSESVTVTGLHTLGEITIKDSCRSTPAVISTAVSMLTASAATEVKRQAALILGHCKPFSESVNATVVAALTESLKDQGIREDVLWALGNLGQQSAGAVPAIQEIMKRSIESEPMDRKMARTAMFTLGQLGPSARSAAPLIFKLFKDQDLEVRSTAMIALGGIEDPSAVPLLSEALQDPVMQIRQLAANSIARIFQAPDARTYVNEAVPLLLEHMRDAPTVREAVVQALSHSGSIAAVRPVIQAISDPDSRVRMAAVSGLGLLAKDPGDASTKDDALKALIQALNDPDLNVVVWAAQALRSFGPAGSAALPSLRRALQQLNGDAAGAVKATIELIETKKQLWN